MVMLYRIKVDVTFTNDRQTLEIECCKHNTVAKFSDELLEELGLSPQLFMVCFFRDELVFVTYN